MKTGTVRQQEAMNEIDKRTRNDIEKRTGKTPEQLHKEREKRLTDVIQLKEPDRVPVLWRGAHFALKNAELPSSAPFYDPVAYKEAIIKTLLEFEGDVLHERMGNITSGMALEKVGTTQFLWPGGPLSPDQSVQFQEGELMKENEYDLFMTDPTDFMLRYYLPRRFSALKDSFSKLPPLGENLHGSVPGLVRMSPIFATEGFQKAAEALFQAGQAQEQFNQWGEEVGDLMGIPQLTYPGGVGNMPFDVFASHLRGMRGTMIDMIKQPEKLLAASEKVLEWRLARAVPANPRGKRTSGSNNHYASEAFMSRKQFEKFCWPTWKKAIVATINLGYINWSLLEGKCDDYLEYFLELPKGKAFIGFETIDIVRAKEILAGHICIMGGVPASLLWNGSAQEVEEHCKKIIKICGKGGGFILGCGVSFDDAKPANVKAMLESVKKYGRY